MVCRWVHHSFTHVSCGGKKKKKKWRWRISFYLFSRLQTTCRYLTLYLPSDCLSAESVALLGWWSLLLHPPRHYYCYYCCYWCCWWRWWGWSRRSVASQDGPTELFSCDGSRNKVVRIGSVALPSRPVGRRDNWGHRGDRRQHCDRRCEDLRSDHVIAETRRSVPSRAQCRLQRPCINRVVDL